LNSSKVAELTAESDADALNSSLNSLFLGDVRVSLIPQRLSNFTNVSGFGEIPVDGRIAVIEMEKVEMRERLKERLVKGRGWF
jgi:hypothetical protein